MALLDTGKEDNALREFLKNFDKGIILNNNICLVTTENIGLVYINMKDIPNAEKWFLKAYG